MFLSYQKKERLGLLSKHTVQVFHIRVTSFILGISFEIEYVNVGMFLQAPPRVLLRHRLFHQSRGRKRGESMRICY